MSESFVDDIGGPLYYETAEPDKPAEAEGDKFVYRYPIPG